MLDTKPPSRRYTCGTDITQPTQSTNGGPGKRQSPQKQDFFYLIKLPRRKRVEIQTTYYVICLPVDLMPTPILVPMNESNNFTADDIENSKTHVCRLRQSIGDRCGGVEWIGVVL